MEGGRQRVVGMWEWGYSHGSRRGWGLSFRDCRHLYSSLICDGAGKVGRRHRSKAQQGLWQDCGRGSGIKDGMLQDLYITCRCLASTGWHGDIENKECDVRFKVKDH